MYSKYRSTLDGGSCRGLLRFADTDVVNANATIEKFTQEEIYGTLEITAILIIDGKVRVQA